MLFIASLTLKEISNKARFLSLLDFLYIFQKVGKNSCKPKIHFGFKRKKNVDIGFI